MAETIGDRIQAVLDRTGWSQRELSRRAGLTEVHVGGILRSFAKNPNASVEVQTVQAIARAAGVSEAWLITGRGSPDADDTARPTATAESVVPVVGNAIGYDDAEAVARTLEQHPEERWQAARGVARYALRGIVQPEDVLEAVHFVAKFSDPARIERQLAEAYDRQRKVIAEAEERAKLQPAPPPAAPPRPRRPRTPH